ncbi:MAG: sugar ABC transporter permease [Clostridia bacterium]|nr:sugar ABC transporter permease [Clostridia bacterium]
MTELDYLKMTAWQKFCYRFLAFFCAIPSSFINFFTVKIPAAAKRVGLCFKNFGLTIYSAARYGDWKTRMSFVVFGFSQLARKQWLRGLLFLVLEIMFILYMSLFGWQYLGMLGTLGTVEGDGWVVGPDGFEVPVRGDNSLLILLYGLLTVLFIFAFVYAWYHSIKSAYNVQEYVEAKQSLATAKDDVKSFTNEQYHKTLLAIPLAGLTLFTILPIIFMIFVAFTNYDKQHMPPAHLFTWVGFDNFSAVLGGGLLDGANFGLTFAKILLWTVIWAFFATFSNYILGIIVALMINKKGIRLKKLWRTVLVMTIAVPQFVSLLLMSQMLGETGVINNLLQSWHIIKKPIPFLSDGTVAKVTVIIVNIWVGIPYTMLISTGILMNIPEDLYESARIDGAGPVKAFFKITMPYMLHVTAPYLITQFIGNLNNFNLIFLLTGGDPSMPTGLAPTAGQTDLLITWLYKLIFNNSQYNIASVISILMFIFTAVVSLIVYNRSSAVKNEEDFM